MTRISQPIMFDAPGLYRVRIWGYLEAHWSDTFHGMAISTTKARGGQPITTLTGELTDQASLMGVLTALYDMGYTLLAVTRLRDRFPAGDDVSRVPT